MENMRIVVEIFDIIGHFEMWQSDHVDDVFQQGLDIVIEEEKP